jgi:GPI mannosyltransferase 2
MVYKGVTKHLYVCSRPLLVSFLVPNPKLILSSHTSRNLGLFRYWTLSNLPLVLLATPMLVMTSISGIWGLGFGRQGQHASNKQPERAEVRFPILRNLAVSQLLLTLLTFTTAHVQIITRISSAYPLWLWYSTVSTGKGNAVVGNLAKFMVMYAVIQGGLFASFLPPA